MRWCLLILLIIPLASFASSHGERGDCTGDIVIEALTRRQYEAMLPAFLFKLPELIPENLEAIGKVFLQTAKNLEGEPLLQIQRFLRFAGDDPAYMGRRVRKRFYPQDDSRSLFMADVLGQVQMIFELIDTYEYLHPTEGLLEATVVPYLEKLRRGHRWGPGNVRLLITALMLNKGRPFRAAIQERFRAAIAAGPSHRALQLPEIINLLNEASPADED